MSLADRVSLIDEELSRVEKEIRRLIGRKTALLAEKTQLNDELLSKSLNPPEKWEEESFPWSESLRRGLKEIFKFSDFRTKQLGAINALLGGNDVLLILPTSGGKSLAYQLPALVAFAKGFAVVVSPLISLMEDQVNALEALGVEAALLNSYTPKEKSDWILKSMISAESSLRLIYVTPERIKKSKRFLAKLQKSHSLGLLNFLAVDEVHCCSQWGHDFRPDYKFLGIIKETFPGISIIGLTATITSTILKEVREILNIPRSLVFKASLDRPNLRYRVLLKTSTDGMDTLCNLLTGEFAGMSGIIYVLTIKQAETVGKEITSRGAANAGFYHGNLDTKERNKMHVQWVKEKIRVIVATTAFGMGIDKANVRFVIHYNMPKSIDNFYQESGRAGRDGKISESVVFFSFADIFKSSIMTFSEKSGLINLYKMVEYCTSTKECRRSILSAHFGENWGGDINCLKMCDYCNRSLKSEETDVSFVASEIVEVLNLADIKEVNLTACRLLDTLMGKSGGSKSITRRIKLPSSWNRVNTGLLISRLIIDGIIKEHFHFTPYNTISYLKITRNATQSIKDYKVLNLLSTHEDSEIITLT